MENQIKLSKREALAVYVALTHYSSLKESLIDVIIDDTDVQPVIDRIKSCLTAECAGACVDKPVKQEQEQATKHVSTSELHLLKPITAKIVSSSIGDTNEEVFIEFEGVSGSCEFLVDGTPINVITHVKRSDTDINVAEEIEGQRAWHIFSAKKLPRAWVELLKDNELLEVRP